MIASLFSAHHVDIYKRCRVCFSFQIKLKGLQICRVYNLLLTSRDTSTQWSKSIFYYVMQNLLIQAVLIFDK